MLPSIVMSKLAEAEQLFATFRATAEKGDIQQAKVRLATAVPVSGAGAVCVVEEERS